MPREKMAGVEGVEPSHTVPETAVLPLDDTPVTLALNWKRTCFRLQTRVIILRLYGHFVKPVSGNRRRIIKKRALAFKQAPFGPLPAEKFQRSQFGIPSTPTMNGTHAASKVIRQSTGTMPALNASPNV